MMSTIEGKNLLLEEQVLEELTPTEVNEIGRVTSTASVAVCRKMGLGG